MLLDSTHTSVPKKCNSCKTKIVYIGLTTKRLYKKLWNGLYIYRNFRGSFSTKYICPVSFCSILIARTLVVVN